MSDSVQPQRRQPSSLPRPWDSPGKNTGVGCHFLLQVEAQMLQICPGVVSICLREKTCSQVCTIDGRRGCGREAPNEGVNPTHTHTHTHSHTHTHAHRPPPTWQYALESPWTSGVSQLLGLRVTVTSWRPLKVNCLCSLVPGDAWQCRHLVQVVELSCMNHTG